jgi:amino acid permease
LFKLLKIAGNWFVYKYCCACPVFVYGVLLVCLSLTVQSLTATLTTHHKQEQGTHNNICIPICVLDSNIHKWMKPWRLLRLDTMSVVPNDAASHARWREYLHCTVVVWKVWPIMFTCVWERLCLKYLYT